MPDKNKFAKLREVGYRVHTTCGLHRYEHKKHHNPDGGRGISIHRAGTCPQADVSPAANRLLGAHAEFLEKP